MNGSIPEVAFAGTDSITIYIISDNSTAQLSERTSSTFSSEVIVGMCHIQSTPNFILAFEDKSALYVYDTTNAPWSLLTPGGTISLNSNIQIK